MAQTTRAAADRDEKARRSSLSLVRILSAALSPAPGLCFRTGPPDEGSPSRPSAPGRSSRRARARLRDDVAAHDVVPGVNRPLHRFDLVGLHWKGSGAVSFRTRSVADAGAAGAPRRPRTTGPTRGTHESRANGLAARQPVLDRALRPDPGAHVRPDQPCPRVLRVEPGRAAPAEDRLDGGLAADHHAAGWRADERSVGAKPALRRRVALRGRPPHRPARTRTRRAQSASIVRGIERYHVLANGWDDIGYNFLVDKYGQVFEGRYGGVDRNVVGAHAQGFNPGSAGVALIGTYDSASITPAAQRRARPAPCLAPGRRARRSALDFQLALDRKPEVPGGARDHAAHDLGAPRHGLHELPGQPALRRAALDRARRLADRPAEAVLPRGHGRTWRARPFHRAAHGVAAVVGDRDAAGRERRRLRAGRRAGHRLDVGRADDSGREVPLRDRRGADRSSGDRHRHRHDVALDADRAGRARRCSRRTATDWPTRRSFAIRCASRRSSRGRSSTRSGLRSRRSSSSRRPQGRTRSAWDAVGHRGRALRDRAHGAECDRDRDDRHAGRDRRSRRPPGSRSSPQVFSPNGDGRLDTTRFSFTLNGPPRRR